VPNPGSFIVSFKSTKKYGSKSKSESGNGSTKRNHLRGVQVPESGYVRLCQIVGDPKANPPIPALLAVGKSSFWAGIKTGRYPKGIKIGPRTTVWSLEAVRNAIQKNVVQGGQHE
jgi:predicted DNA-binding transcriptional regulator AlpA